MDGFRATAVSPFVGPRAAEKAAKNAAEEVLVTERFMLHIFVFLKDKTNIQGFRTQ